MIHDSQCDTLIENCSIKLLYSYLTNPYHRWYGENHVFEYWYRQLHQDLGHQPWEAARDTVETMGHHENSFWLFATIWPLTHPSMFSQCNMHHAGSFAYTNGSPSPGRCSSGHQRFGRPKIGRHAKIHRCWAEKGRQISGPLSHFVCQSLSRKIWPSRLIWGGSGKFWRYLGNTSKEWEL